MEAESEKKKGGRPPGGKYGAGKGATARLVRLEDPLLAFVDEWPGGLKGVVQAAYTHRKRLK